MKSEPMPIIKKCGVSVEKYQEIKNDPMNFWGDDLIPVDLNGAFVPLKKTDEDKNLKEAEQNVKDRFSL